MQPPTIRIAWTAQIDKNFNKCLDHARAKTDFRGRPRQCDALSTAMASARSRRRGVISARSATCPGSGKPLVGNSFENEDAMSRKAAGAPRTPSK
jgi:nitrate reductase cytochrome c-type subunit